MIKIEINGQVVEAHEGDMLIDVADDAQIPIPRFCYHKKLSVAANCRMCLVEVEGAPKALPACATPVTDGMKVYTRSPKARAAQKAVMEFLLINHPLDCPICDQGGECELQDVAFEYGDDVGKYSEAKRVVPDHDIGPLIATDMTRCIHCTRCVRFGQEISGLMELGAVGRSEWMEITTFVGKSITSEISGNIIDLCPVGALTSKPFRYKARAWELKAEPSIAGHDSIGSNIEVHTYHGKVMRVVPRENEAINEVWLSDRDRFAYEGFNSEDRLTVPKFKKGDRWEEAEWEEALAEVVNRLKPYLDQPDQIGVLASPNATVEELYLLQKLARALGIESLDFRLRQPDGRVDEQGVIAPVLHHALPEVESLNQILLIGSNLRYELPLLNLRVRKAQLAGAQVYALNPVDYPFTFDLADRMIARPSRMVTHLAALVKVAMGEQAPEDVAGVETTPQHERWVEALKKEGSSIFVGAITQMSPEYAQMARLAALLAQSTGATLNILPMSANTVGAHAVNFLPGEGGEDANTMLAQATKKVFITLGIEPEFDSLYGVQALKAMEEAELVVSLTAFETDAMRAYADVLLPIATYAETAGTFVNANGTWQSFRIAATAPGDAKPAWKILRVLGNLFELNGFEHVNADEVREEAQAQSRLNADALKLADLSVRLDGVRRDADREVVPFLSLYSTDAIVRRSQPLQAAAGAARAVAESATESAHVRFDCDGQQVSLPHEHNEAVAEGVYVVPVAIPETLSVPVTCVRVAGEQG